MHAEGALGRRDVGGDLGGREARRQRIVGQDREDLGRGDGVGGEGGVFGWGSAFRSGVECVELRGG